MLRILFLVVISRADMLFIWSLLFLNSAFCSKELDWLSNNRVRLGRHAPVAEPVGRALSAQSPIITEQGVLTDQDAAPNKTLNVFQVYKPVTIPDEARQIHSTVLVNHSFQNSYGKPFVSDYAPPGFNFTNVHINLTVTSRGRQFDRLALLYLGDVEIFRTSTAEPSPQGIVWSYSKDMTAYLTLWKTKQRVIFDLGNLVNEMYTGFFNVTITATFFNLKHRVVTADLILPISAKRGSEDKPSAFIIPSDNTTTMISVPPNTSRAIVSIAACGQAEEEFWYSNVPTSTVSTWQNVTGNLLGYSSFREIQLYIDGMLAGVVWPFPIIFTGGLAPGLWKPMVGIDAFDLREFEIDIAPFIMLLTDGKDHSFQIRVVGLVDSNGGEDAALSDTVGNNWVVTGKLFVFLDPYGANPQWEHVPPNLRNPSPSVYINTRLTQSLNETTHSKQNDSLAIRLSVSRELTIFSLSGLWQQHMTYFSDNDLSNEGLDQLTLQGSFGSFKAVAVPRTGPPVEWDGFFTQPVTVYTNMTIHSDRAGKPQGIGISALVRRTLQYVMSANSRPDISVYTLQQGDNDLYAYQGGQAKYSSQPNRSYSFGSTTEDFREGTAYGGYMRRSVEVVNGSVVRDWPGYSNVDESVGQIGVKAFELLEGAKAALGAGQIVRIGRGPHLYE